MQAIPVYATELEMTIAGARHCAPGQCITLCEFLIQWHLPRASFSKKPREPEQNILGTLSFS